MNFTFRICPAEIIQDDFVSTNDFRKLNIQSGNLNYFKEKASKNKMSVGELAALLICENNGSNTQNLKVSKLDLFFYKICYEKKQAENFNKIKIACEAVLNDLKYFPVAKTHDGDAVFQYSDSWMGDRDFGGKRHHEGTDIMSPDNVRGKYEVVSMTDGVVEKIGWLKLGGYRIGICSESGGYFYYAHLDSYARDFKEGDIVKAGELIGYMGDSGYGPEKTVGKFDVHLHLGIYIRDNDGNEMSVNPFYVLKSLEENKQQLN